MKIITKDKCCFSLSPKHKPFGEISLGETFSVQIEDAYAGKIRSVKDKFSHAMLEALNPATGPIFIKGAIAGQILCINIKSINLRPYAISCFEAGFGPMKKMINEVECSFMPIRGKEIEITSKIKKPIQSSIGFIATAPAPAKNYTNTMAAEHGGNLSCKEISEGSSIYLPINVDGALLALGRLKAFSSDGEVAGCGAEVAGEVILNTSMTSLKIPTPLVETKHSLHFLASSKSLDTAEESLLVNVMSFLCNTLKMQKNEAVKIMDLTGELGICSIWQNAKTLRFSLSKKILLNYGWNPNFLKRT